MAEENLEKEQTEEEIREEEFASVYEDTAVEDVVLKPEEKKEEIEPEQVPPEVSPELQERFDILQRTIDEKETRLKGFEQRVGSLQEKYNEAIKVAETLKSAPTRKQIEAAIKSQKKWEELKEDFPSFELVDERMGNAENELRDSISVMKSDIGNFGQTRDIAAANAKIKAVRSDVEKLASYYPDFSETVKSEAFLGWLNDQPPHDRERRDSDSLYDALYLMHGFQKSIAKPTVQEQRDKRLAQSAETEKGKNLIYSSSKTDEELTEAELRARVFDEVYKEE